MKNFTAAAKRLLAAFFVLAACVLLPGMTAKAEADNMGIIRLNLTLSSAVLTGPKMDAFLYTMNKMHELGMIRRSSSYQSFDLDLNGEDDIGYDAMSSTNGGMISLHTTPSPSLESKEFTVPDTVKQQAASEGRNWCDKICLTLSGDPYRALSIGTTQGGGFIINGTYNDCAINMTLEKDEVLTLRCAPEKNYKFAGWYEGIVSSSYFVSGHTGILISQENELTIDSKSNMDVCAVYTRTSEAAAKANPMSVKAKTMKLSVKKVKQKKQVIAAKKALTIKNAKGKVTYKLTSVTKSKFRKNFSINEKNGKITIKKGTKKGTYTLKIKVKAAGNASYLPAEKTVKVKVKIS